ncbi:MAG: hypothetical protein AB2598_20085 [Candidatus Thiodiazotropha sp.]
MADLSTSDLVQIIGWPVTFILGVVATLIAQRIGKKKKRISWSLVSESNFLSKDALEQINTEFRVPVKVIVGEAEQSDLSIVRVKVANTGNIEVENFTLNFDFGSEAKVHVGRYIGKLGAYRQALSLEKTGSSAALSIQHINPKQSFEAEFLVGDYHPGDFNVDLSAPGVSLQRTDLAALEASKEILKSISYGAIGVKYDPNATQTAFLVDELKRLRKVIENKNA